MPLVLTAILFALLIVLHVTEKRDESKQREKEENFLRRLDAVSQDLKEIEDDFKRIERMRLEADRMILEAKEIALEVERKINLVEVLCRLKPL
jgi:uncharacterized UPF0160 family protein